MHQLKIYFFAFVMLPAAMIFAQKKPVAPVAEDTSAIQQIPEQNEAKVAVSDEAVSPAPRRGIKKGGLRIPPPPPPLPPLPPPPPVPPADNSRDE